MMVDFAAQSPVVTTDVNAVDVSAFQVQHTVGNDVSSAADAIVNLPSIFDLLDLEGNGDLDFAEFKVGLNSIGVALTHDEAIKLFESIDTENEEYINKESFMDWLSKGGITQQMSDIRNKLIVALNTAQEINNPQWMDDEDEIADLLGNKAEYMDEIEKIKKESFDDGNESDGTFKVHQSDDTEEDEQQQTNHNNADDDNESDSLDSEERTAIKKAKIKRDSENAQDLESTLMEQQMKAMMEQEKYALDREISGRNTYREEDASKWKKEEIETELHAMTQQFTRLRQGSLSIVEVQDEVQKTMQQFRKLSEDTMHSPSKMESVHLNPQSNQTKKSKPPPIQTTAAVVNSLSPRHATGALTPTTRPKSPIQEIQVTTPQHTTSSQPVMITAAEQQRRNSLSESYSMRGAGAYAMSAPMTDISHYTQQQPMHEQLIMSRSVSINRGGASGNTEDEKHLFVRLVAWYLAPMHERSSLHALWYHGANAVLSFVICAIMLSLFALSLAFLPFCGVGLIFTYFQCVLSRHFAAIDSRFSYYFFGSGVFPRFSIFIPKSHQQSVIGALKEYITDPHMLQVIAYFTFIKLPAAFILSGIAMVIFSGVTSILLSPLIFWLDPQYFEDDLYCLFGSRVTDPVHPNKMLCNGWAINSFGETFLAFLVFIPALPLTLHLSNAAANMLSRLTLNFLSINSPNSPPLTSSAKQKMNPNSSNQKQSITQKIENQHRI